jgi:penicillin-binding protein 2
MIMFCEYEEFGAIISAMVPNKFSRRTFLQVAIAQTALVSLTLAGCRPRANNSGGGLGLGSQSAAPSGPPPTPTPPYSADGTVQLFLDAWPQGDYRQMYSVVTPDIQALVPYEQFVNQYLRTASQMTARSLQVEVRSLLVEDVRATATYHTTWSTNLFGDLEADQTMNLRFEQGRWLVAWDQTLILPQLAKGGSLALYEEYPERGLIYDAADHALAAQTQAVTIGVVPGQISDEAVLVDQLTLITQVSPARIREKISAARPDWFVPIAEVSFETNVQYHDTLSSLAGVQRQPHPVRTYPDGDLAAHVIGTMGGIPAEQLDSYTAQGYTGDELVGLAGIEAWGEPFLAGRRGGRLVVLSALREEIETLGNAPVKPGGNVYLSLDTTLQQRLEDILGTRQGSMVLMQPNGLIQALVSYPRYNPGDFAMGISVETWNSLINNEDRPLVNRATQGTYPPGSVFKVISTAAALDHLGYGAQTPFYCSGTWDGLGDRFIKKCWKEEGHGNITLQDGLTQSCDVVYYEIGLALHRLDPNIMPNLARAFGLGQTSGLLGLSEFAGVVPDNEWKTAVRGEPFFDGDAVNMAIGQGDILSTPLQMARMMATVANYGTLPVPQLIRRLSSRDTGDQFFEPQTAGTVPVLPETLSMIQDAMYNVVHSPRGTAAAAFEGFAYTAVGKTGTSESGVEIPHAWFAGYAPAIDPQVVVAVIVENAGEGSAEAAPLFRQAVETYFDWMAGA